MTKPTYKEIKRVMDSFINRNSFDKIQVSWLNRILARIKAKEQRE